MTIVICATIGLQLLIFLCTVCRGDTFYIEPLVELESQDAFVDFYKDHALGLVLYTTVNCPECIDLQLRLREGVALFNETAHVEVPIAKITHDRNDITVRGLYYDAPHFGPSTPSLEVVRYGKLCRGRWRAATTTAEGIAGFLHLLSKAAYHNVSSDTDFPTGFSPVSGFSPTQRPVTDSRIVIAGYFLDGKDTSLWEDFKEAIEWYREQELVSVYVVSNPELMRQWRVDPPRIAVYNEATTGLVDWYGNLASETSVASFLSAKARPFAMVPWTTNFNDRDRVVTTMVMLFYQNHLQPQPDEDDSALDDPEATLPAESAACMDRVVQLLAIPLRKALHPTDQYAVGVRPFTKQVKRRFNVEARSNVDIPISTREGECEADVHVVVTHSGKPFSYKQPVLLSRAPHLLPRLVDFVGVVRGGERSEVAIRSQPASLTDMARIGGSGTVITMVALTFEKVIRRVNTISFVGLFSSSCRDECREPRALLRDLAYAFRHTPSVVIAEFDQSANDMPPQFRRDDSPSFFTIPLFVDWVSEWYDGPVTYEAIYQYIVSMTPDFDPHAPVPTRTAPPSGVAEARCVDDSKCEDELNDFAEEEERDVRMQQARRWKGPTWQQRARR